MSKGYARIVSVFLGLSLCLTAFPKSLANADPPRVIFELGPAGIDLQDPATLLIAASLNNTGSRNAYKVKVTSIALITALTTKPSTFPLKLGEIDAGGGVVLQTAFKSFTQFNPGQHLLLLVHGEFDQSNHSDRFWWEPEDFDFPENFAFFDDRDFTVLEKVVLPPASPGSANVQTGNAGSNTVTGGTFPPVLIPKDFDQANEPGPPVPTSTDIFAPPANGGSMVKQDPGDPAVDFIANDPLNLVSGGFTGQASTTAEPSGGANGGGVIFATANWTAAYSNNGGSSFTQLNPTTIFPNDTVGYCCDQIVQYVPSIDRFVWLLQGNGYRLASASPSAVTASGGTSWTYWNLTPAFFGFTGENGSLDYPDMSVGTNYLYLSFDHTTKGAQGLMVARISLSQIQAGGTVTVEWTNPTDSGLAYLSHLTQDTENEVFWAGHKGNDQLRVWSWAEGSGSYFWRDVGISGWDNNTISSLTPDGQNWLAVSPSGCCKAILGATRAPGPSSTSTELFSDGLWFAWTAGTDSNFQQPHVEMVTLDRGNNFAKVQQVQIWNNDYAFGQPALATNACTGEVGFSMEYGGNSKYYENHVVGFWGDFIAYITTNSNVGTNRFGDYVTIRQDFTPDLDGGYFDAFGYGLNTPPAGSTGTQTDIHYVLFGRTGCGASTK